MSDYDSNLVPYGESSSNSPQDAAVEAQKFLEKICMPVAEELGTLLVDTVNQWRYKNIVKILLKAEGIYNSHGMEGFRVHPRIASQIIEIGCWYPDDEVQSMWAGLLASSCTEEGTQDDNLLFVNIMAQLNTLEFKLIKFLATEVPVVQYLDDIHCADIMEIHTNDLLKVLDDGNRSTYDRIFDHLRAMGMLQVFPKVGGGGYTNASLLASLCPSDLMHYLHIKCQGDNSTISQYYKLKEQDYFNKFKIDRLIYRFDFEEYQRKRGLR